MKIAKWFVINPVESLEMKTELLEVKILSEMCQKHIKTEEIIHKFWKVST